MANTSLLKRRPIQLGLASGMLIGLLGLIPKGSVHLHGPAPLAAREVAVNFSAGFIFYALAGMVLAWFLDSYLLQRWWGDDEGSARELHDNTYPAWIVRHLPCCGC